MRLSTTFILCLLAGPAMAESCDHWTASMQEDEGGPAMMASICSGKGDDQSNLVVQCGAPGDVVLRFTSAPSAKYPPLDTTGNFQAEMKYTLDKDTFSQKAILEEMDGAMASYVPMKDPLIEAMMTRGSLVVSDADGKLADVTFTLKNSGNAFRKLMKACGQ